MQTVTVQHERANAPKQVRISTDVKRAIDLMVHSGLRRDTAAQQVGLHDETMRRSLTFPHVLAYMNSQMQVLRQSAIARTVQKAEHLMDFAESERVQLEAVRYLNPPIERTENLHVHQGSIPGLTIVFNTSPVETPMVIEAKQVDNTHYGKSDAKLLK